MKSSLLFAIFAMLLCWNAFALQLTDTGRPVAEIVIGQNADETECYAAEELQRAVRLISGAPLPIRKGAATDKPAVIIGTPKSQTDIGGRNYQFRTENEVLVIADGNRLYLTGQHSRDALYAVYTYLQDVLDCRWLYPGEDGEYLPKLPTITVEKLNLRHIPSLKYRAFGNSVEGNAVWQARNRLNFASFSVRDTLAQVKEMKKYGFVLRLAGHNAHLPVGFLKEHPEYCAQVHGERSLASRQLCWSNPDVQKLVADNFIKIIDKVPIYDVISFYPADNVLICGCEKCGEMAKDASTRWQKFCETILQQLRSHYPDKQYSTLAYYPYESVPTFAASFDSIGYCAGMNFRGVFDKDDPANQRFYKEFAGWQKLVKEVYLRGYDLTSLYPRTMFRPLVSYEVALMNWLKEIGASGFFAEGFGYRRAPEDQRKNPALVNRISAYAAAQASWNTEITTQEILDRWMPLVYGPAAKPMEECYKTLEAAWRSSSKALTGWDHPAAKVAPGFISDSLIEKVEKCFSAAHSAAALEKDEEKRKQIEDSIQLQEYSFNQWKEMFLILDGRNQGDKNMLFYDAEENSMAVRLELSKLGFRSRTLKEDTKQIEQGIDAVLLRYPKQNKKFHLSDAFMRNGLKDYLEKGGCVILQAEGGLPLEKWLPATGLKMRWTAKLERPYRIVTLADGSWRQTPNSLENTLKIGPTPRNAVTKGGYVIESGDVMPLATVALGGGGEAVWLVRVKVGKGTLYVTTANLGYWSQYQNHQYVARLIDNLVNMAKSLQ